MGREHWEDFLLWIRSPEFVRCWTATLEASLASAIEGRTHYLYGVQHLRRLEQREQGPVYRRDPGLPSKQGKGPQSKAPGLSLTRNSSTFLGTLHHPGKRPQTVCEVCKQKV